MEIKEGNQETDRLSQATQSPRLTQYGSGSAIEETNDKRMESKTTEETTSKRRCVILDHVQRQFLRGVC